MLPKAGSLGLFQCSPPRPSDLCVSGITYLLLYVLLDTLNLSVSLCQGGGGHTQRVCGRDCKKSIHYELSTLLHCSFRIIRTDHPSRHHHTDVPPWPSVPEQRVRVRYYVLLDTVPNIRVVVCRSTVTKMYDDWCVSVHGDKTPFILRPGLGLLVVIRPWHCWEGRFE